VDTEFPPPPLIDGALLLIATDVQVLLSLVALPLVALPPVVLLDTDALPLAAVWLLVLLTLTLLLFVTL
jgi:hypothetical protein